MAIKDKADVTDEVETEVLKGVAASTPTFPCPKCKSTSKEDHEKGMRVCFNKACRHRFAQKDVQPVLVAAPGPVNPCPKCGQETKEHHTPPGARICSSRSCRHLQLPPAG